MKWLSVKETVSFSFGKPPDSEKSFETGTENCTKRKEDTLVLPGYAGIDSELKEGEI